MGKIFMKLMRLAGIFNCEETKFYYLFITNLCKFNLTKSKLTKVLKSNGGFVHTNAERLIGKKSIIKSPRYSSVANVSSLAFVNIEHE